MDEEMEMTRDEKVFVGLVIVAIPSLVSVILKTISGRIPIWVLVGIFALGVVPLALNKYYPKFQEWRFRRLWKRK